MHEASWLRFSNGTSKEGQASHAFANVCGLVEKVAAPPRGDYLLDLVLFDLGSELRCKVIDGVSDHNAILGTVAFGVPQFHEIQREYFDYKRAPWDKIRKYLETTQWDEIFAALDCDKAAQFLEDRITEIIRKHIS